MIQGLHGTVEGTGSLGDKLCLKVMLQRKYSACPKNRKVHARTYTQEATANRHLRSAVSNAEGFTTLQNSTVQYAEASRFCAILHCTVQRTTYSTVVGLEMNLFPESVFLCCRVHVCWQVCTASSRSKSIALCRCRRKAGPDGGHGECTWCCRTQLVCGCFVRTKRNCGIVGAGKATDPAVAFAYSTLQYSRSMTVVLYSF